MLSISTGDSTTGKKLISNVLRAEFMFGLYDL